MGNLMGAVIDVSTVATISRMYLYRKVCAFQTDARRFPRVQHWCIDSHFGKRGITNSCGACVSELENTTTAPDSQSWCAVMYYALNSLVLPGQLHTLSRY